MRTAELFCGTKSFSKVAEAGGASVWTLDLDPAFAPDVAADVRELDPVLLPRPLDVLWASPPCTAFSVASIGAQWTGGRRAYVPKSEGAREGLDVLSRTIDIVASSGARLWFIENPRGVMRKVIDREFAKAGVWNYARRTITYCAYGDVRMKPTDVWTNCLSWVPRPACRNGDPCHEAAPRGARTGTQGIKGSRDRAVVPEVLCTEVLDACAAEFAGMRGTE